MSNIQDHPEYRGLLAGVRAAPDDDLPRLVLADWLEEHDSSEWAEFIRAQCLLERFPHAARVRAGTYTDDERVLPDWQQPLAAAQRERELWPTVAKEVFAGMPGANIVGWFSSGEPYLIDDDVCPELCYVIRRGFVDWMRYPLLHRWVGVDEPFGPFIVGRQPLQRVIFTDRVNQDLRTTSWYAVPADETAFHPTNLRRLPWCIASRLTNYVRRTEEMTTDPPLQVWVYADEEQATEALSRAAIAWAEAEAGL